MGKVSGKQQPASDIIDMFSHWRVFPYMLKSISDRQGCYMVPPCYISSAHFLRLKEKKHDRRRARIPWSPHPFWWSRGDLLGQEKWRTAKGLFTLIRQCLLVAMMLLLRICFGAPPRWHFRKDGISDGNDSNYGVNITRNNSFNISKISMCIFI